LPEVFSICYAIKMSIQRWAKVTTMGLIPEAKYHDSFIPAGQICILID